MQIFKKYITILFILLHFCVNAQAEEEKLKIAILDFNNTGGITLRESNTLVYRLRSMLVQNSNLIVIERGKMEDILKEQGFQKTGCTSTDCAVEVGKLLNVQKMISGSIGKIGETYTIDIVLIDVVSAQINKSFMRNYKGAADGLLEVIQSISDEIAVLSTKKEEIKKHVISITSRPVEADLFINDKHIGKTPFKSMVNDGRYFKITIKKENYKDWEKKITVSENIEFTANLEMTEAYKEELAEKARKEQQKSIGKSEVGSGNTWLWIGGGAAIVAGGIAYFILSQKDEDKPTQAGSIFPDSPPGRPPSN